MAFDDSTLKEQVAALPRTFVPPSELAGSRPRDVALSGAGKAVYAIAMALFAGALVAGLLLNRELVREAGDRAAFAKDGAAITAEVTRLWLAGDANRHGERATGDSTPWVAYRFETTSGAYDGQSRISRNDWKNLHLGSRVEALYLSNDPSRSMLTIARTGSVPAWLPIVVGLAIAAIGVLCLGAISRQRRLLANGRAAPAIVTKVRKHHTSHGGSHRTISYAFPLLSGAMATGKSDSSRKAPETGAVLCIVYDPDRPQRSQLYPIPFVRALKPGQ